jgi:hypothetical protein
MKQLYDIIINQELILSEGLYSFGVSSMQIAEVECHLPTQSQGHASFATGVRVRWLAIGSWDKVQCSTERVLILELWADALFPPTPDEKRLVRFCDGSSHIRGSH